MKLLMDGKNPLASNGGILFDIEDSPVQTISATSNQKYAPKVLYNNGTTYSMPKKPTSNLYGHYDPYYSSYGSRWDDGGWGSNWRSARPSTPKEARTQAKQKLGNKGHKVVFVSRDEKNHLMEGTCKHCGKPAYLMFIPFANEYVMEGSAFEVDCPAKPKAIDTVSTKIQDKTVFTPVKTKGNFDVKLENYPLGIVSEGGGYDEYC